MFFITFTSDWARMKFNFFFALEKILDLKQKGRKNRGKSSNFFAKSAFRLNLIDPMNSYIGQFASFPVVSITSIGAFLDWGEPKDLFLPTSEQLHRVEFEETVVVFIYLDKQERPCASMRLSRFVSEDFPDYKPEQKAKGLIYHETDLGYQVLVDQKYLGLLYKNEVFRRLRTGEEVDVYVKKVREDHKIDLNLRAAGHQANTDISSQILNLLQKNNGFFPLTDKTSPEKIYELFSVSKKKYKIALGQLYKNRKIEVREDGIHLVVAGDSSIRPTGPAKKF